MDFEKSEETNRNCFFSTASWIVNQYSSSGNKNEKNTVAQSRLKSRETNSAQPVLPGNTDNAKSKLLSAALPRKESEGNIQLKKQQPSKQLPEKSFSPRKSKPAENEVADAVSAQQKTIPTTLTDQIKGIQSSPATRGKDTSYIFKGRVSDELGDPIPFATIIPSDKNKATVADAKGNFSIASNDTLLMASIASMGFQSNRILLNPHEDQMVVLKRSESLQEVIITALGQRRTKGKAKRSNAKITYEEPADGIKKYNAYVARSRKPIRNENKVRNGEVILLFDIDKEGLPQNIKIEKTLCLPCDNEAIRLLSEGPKWQTIQSKKGRLVVKF